MKTRLITLAALLALVLLALPASAPAMCGYWKTECARFKAGKEVKSGMCDVFGCADKIGEVYGACFVEKKCEDRGAWSKLGMYWRCDDTERGDCPPEFKLEGGPATPRKKPLKGKGWTCFDKKGADVTMCVKADFGEPEDR